MKLTVLMPKLPKRSRFQPMDGGDYEAVILHGATSKPLATVPFSFEDRGLMKPSGYISRYVRLYKARVGDEEICEDTIAGFKQSMAAALIDEDVL